MEQRKHPVCQVKGCERLQSKKISVGVNLPEHATNKELFDDAPFELGLCEMHAGWFESAKDMHISMGHHIRDSYTLHGEEE